MKRIPTFVAGMLTAAVIGALGVGALAASGAVTFNASNLQLNGQQISAKGENYTLANGQQVPASITYTDETGGGTTYLPVRRISELLGVETGWDGATGSVTVKGEVKPSAIDTTQVLDLVSVSDGEVKITIGDLEFVDGSCNGWSHVWFYAGDLSRSEVLDIWNAYNKDELQTLFESATKQFGTVLGNPWDEVGFLVEYDAKGHGDDIRFARCNVGRNGSLVQCQIYQPPIEYQADSLY